MKLLDTNQIRAADQMAIEQGISGFYLMQRAAAAICSHIEQISQGPCNVVVIAGGGNNGGDALVAAGLLKQRDYKLDVHILCPINRLKGDAAQAATFWREQGGTTIEGYNQEAFKSSVQNAEIIIDGLFGAGLNKPVRGDYAKVIHEVNMANKLVIAIDIPSGIDGDTGKIYGTAINASHTVSFVRPKPGHYLYPGRKNTGQLSIHEIGIPERIVNQISSDISLNTPSLWNANFINKADDSHKYHQGTVLVVGGDESMQGASVLASNAALRTGAGLVTLSRSVKNAQPHPNSFSAIMLSTMPNLNDPPETQEPNWSEFLKNKKINTVLIGPGHTPDKQTRNLTLTLLQEETNLIIDAGAITAFENNKDELFQAINKHNEITDKKQVILTPHEGEFKRLFGAIGQNGKLAAAKDAAQLSGAIIILKGADTVIAAPDGRGAINYNAPPTLATGGTGDVLAGIVTGLIAKGMTGFEAAAAAVYIHGECASKINHNLIADDLIEQIPTTIQQSLRH